MAVGTTSDLKEKMLRAIGSIEDLQLKPSENDLDLAVTSGLRHFNSVRPRTRVYQAAGSDTTKRFILDSVISDWIPGFSKVLSVLRVTDPDTDDEQQDVLDPQYWDVRLNSSDEDVLFLPETIGSSSTMRVRYTTTHLVDVSVAANTTVDDSDETLLVYICAAWIAKTVSMRAMDLVNIELGAQEVDYRRLRDAWKMKADALLGMASEIESPKSLSSAPTALAHPWKSKSRMTRKNRIGH